MNSSVVLIGYGNAGKIHKNIFETLGYECIVVEKDVSKMSELKGNYFTSVEKVLDELDHAFIYDICVDTDSHLEVLMQILSKVKNPNIIIEKPVVNSLDQLNILKGIIQNHKCNLFVNENYLFLSSEKLIKELMQKNSFNDFDLYIEFSKDRLGDRVVNRFEDKSLLSAGIEGPHMFAVLSLFLDIKKLELVESFCDLDQFHANYLVGKNNVRLYSSLTDHKKFNDSLFLNSHSKLRVLEIAERNGKRIVVIFGSSQDLKTRIFVLNANNVLLEESIEDNSMLHSLKFAVDSFEKKDHPAFLDKNILFIERLVELVNFQKINSKILKNII